MEKGKSIEDGALKSRKQQKRSRTKSRTLDYNPVTFGRVLYFLLTLGKYCAIVLYIGSAIQKGPTMNTFKPIRSERRAYAMRVIEDLGLTLITAKKYKIPSHIIVVSKDNDAEKISEMYNRIIAFSNQAAPGWGIGINPNYGARFVTQQRQGAANIGHYDSNTAIGYGIELG